MTLSRLLVLSLLVSSVALGAPARKKKKRKTRTRAPVEAVQPAVVPPPEARPPPSEPVRAAAPSPRPAGPSRLHVRCTHNCRVFVDGQRRAGEARGAVIEGLAPGAHDVDVKVGFSQRAVKGPVQLPAGSEVFLVVTSDDQLRVTTTKPL